MKMKCVGFIGLGKMGFPVACRLIKAGFSLCVYDTQKSLVDKLGRHGAMRCHSIQDVASQLPAAKVILMCVPAGQAVDARRKEVIRISQLFQYVGTEIVASLINRGYRLL